MLRAEEKGTQARRAWLFKTKGRRVACVPTGHTSARWATPRPFPWLQHHLLLLVGLTLGKNCYGGRSLQFTVWFCGGGSTTTCCWDPARACFPGLPLDLTENLDEPRPAQPPLHEVRATVCSGCIPHPFPPHSHDKPEPCGHIPELSSQT